GRPQPGDLEGRDDQERGDRAHVGYRDHEVTKARRVTKKSTWINAFVAASCHSYRSATTGSTRAARRAGRTLATAATATSSSVMPASVSGSRGSVRKRNVCSSC